MTLALRASASPRGGGRPVLVVLMLAVLALAMAAGVATAAPKFPPLTGRVVDNAEILSPEAEAKLTDELAALEQKTGRQVVVATVPDLQGYEIEDYGYQLGRTWGIGDKDRDDGVVFLIAPGERKVRIEVGYGLEPVLTDALSNLILQRAVLPAFKAGDMEGGVVAGTESIVAQLGLPEGEARAIAAKAAETSQAPEADIPIPVIIFIIVMIIVLSRMFGGWWWLPFLFSGGGGGRGHWRGGGGGGFGGGGFSGGGGSFGGGGSSGDW